jgi:hypothetical protein
MSDIVWGNGTVSSTDRTPEEIVNGQTRAADYLARRDRGRRL